jgi:AcrR family transcriptional regulator
LREIAKRAGIDHSTLHYYFSGKEALIDGVVDHIEMFVVLVELHSRASFQPLTN